MRYCQSNRYVVYNALRELGGKATSDKILEKVNETNELFTKNSLSHYIGRLCRSGHFQINKTKGLKMVTYFIPKVDISTIDSKTWVNVVFLIFKKYLSFEEISNVLEIKLEVVKEIFVIECLNNHEMKMFAENEANKNKIIIE